MKKTVFTGSATALITPFSDNGVDFESFGKLIDWQIEQGTDALVVCGTTGEPATMTYEEREETVKFAVKRVNGRVPVIVGTGSNATHIAVSNTRRACDNGADAVLVVTPYYNKCSQLGLLKHYEAVCDASTVPVICYNVPGRTGVNIAVDTLEKMAEHEKLCAIKEASGDMDRICNIFAQVGDKIDIYSGDDALTVPMLSLGGKGVISVASNILPSQVHKMCTDFFEGNITDSAKMQTKLYPLIKALFCETNPIPVKAAASVMGICQNILRLPLCEISDKNFEYLKKEMTSFGIEF